MPSLTVSLLLIFFSVLPSDESGSACQEREFRCTNYLSCTLTTSNGTRASYLLTQCSIENAISYNTYTVLGLDGATLVLNIPPLNGYYLTIYGTNTLIISNVEILAKELTIHANALLTIPHVFPPLPNVEYLILQMLELESFPTINSPHLRVLTMNYIKLPDTTVILPSMLVTPNLKYLTLIQTLDSPWFLLNPDTFDNMLSLDAGATFITITGVLHLHSYQFANVVNLRDLTLNFMSSDVTYEKDALAGLSTMSQLFIEHSKINAIDLILDVTFPNIVALYLRSNLITSLPQEFFERHKLVNFLKVDNNPLNCTCEMSWVSYAYYTLGWTISGTCINGNNIFNNSNYVNCPIQSYHCFNDTLYCPTDRSRCVNTQDSAYCECFQGYTFNSSTCVDIDECSLKTDNCSQNCVNTERQYNCTCLFGYSLDSDLTSCVDIDECSLKTDNCSQNCTNTEGQYNCTCLLGYSLNSDLTSCVDIDECSLETYNCSQNCMNTEGSYECICKDGYILQSNSFSCNKSCGSRLTIGLTHILLLLVLLLYTTTL